MLSRCVVLAATIALVAACGGVQASANPTAIPIAGPWQAQPFAPIDVRFATATEAACREMGGIQPAQVQVVLHDQRGSGVDTVILVGRTASRNATVSCARTARSRCPAAAP